METSTPRSAPRSIALGYDGGSAPAPTARRWPHRFAPQRCGRWSPCTTVSSPSHAGCVLDLGATAKAVAADQCAQRVHEVTGSGALINLGGDIATAGPAPVGGWPVLVHDAEGDPASSVVLPAGAALATSSTIRRRWRRGEDLVHHILDPRTGRSADPVWRTVSVAAQTCYAANTVATAAVVRGWAAPAWIRTLGLSARLVDRDRGVHTVAGWPRADAGWRR